jgi:sn-glycerol 3-phosphate transport system permease protein
MVERRTWFSSFLPHFILILGVLIVAFPVYVAFVGSSWDAGTIANGAMPLYPGSHLVENYSRALFSGNASAREPVGPMLLNSFIMAIIIAFGKIAISIISAYAVVYFRFPLRQSAFWLIFITLMLPVEVRIFPTFKVVSDLGLVNTHAGLIIPLIASATATLLFRQFFLTIPDEFVEAAKMDGAGPLRFLWDVVLPLSRTNMAALFVILFVYGWNQYLWPLLVTTSAEVETVVIGMVKMIGSEANTEWQIVMATCVLSLLPPVAVVVLMQRWFVKGLTETEK